MQSYGGAMPAVYPAYVYAPSAQSASVYPGMPPPLGSHQASRSQSSRYDPAVPPPGAYLTPLNGPPIIPPDPNGPALRPRRLHDRAVSDPTKKPLKSALKRSGGSGSSTPGSGPNSSLHRSRTVPAGDPDGYRGREMKPTASGMSRHRSLSGSSRHVRATSTTRQRSQSRARRIDTPGEYSFGSTFRTNASTHSAFLYY